MAVIPTLKYSRRKRFCPFTMKVLSEAKKPVLLKLLTGLFGSSRYESYEELVSLTHNPILTLETFFWNLALSWLPRSDPHQDHELPLEGHVPLHSWAFSDTAPLGALSAPGSFPPTLASLSSSFHSLKAHWLATVETDKQYLFLEAQHISFIWETCSGEGVYVDIWETGMQSWGEGWVFHRYAECVSCLQHGKIWRATISGFCPSPVIVVQWQVNANSVYLELCQPLWRFL